MNSPTLDYSKYESYSGYYFKAGKSYAFGKPARTANSGTAVTVADLSSTSGYYSDFLSGSGSNPVSEVHSVHLVIRLHLRVPGISPLCLCKRTVNCIDFYPKDR